jgi:catalase
MNEHPLLTTDAGAPVADNQHSQTAGANGPTLLQDHHLIEKLARFDRERIPERVVHARGSGAFGHFEVVADVSHWTKAAFLQPVGKRTAVFVRFSTVALEAGSADTVRDPRGFAIKFYTEEGNYDLVGNNTPIFFIRDAMKFPDFIHAQKRDPRTHLRSPDNAWDFFAHSPEATHQFTWLFGDRGIPRSYRHMDGFGSHAFQWTNVAGEAFWVKYHFKTNQGIECLSAAEAARLAGERPDHHHADLFDAIEQSAYPSWTLKVQVMTSAEATRARIDPFDVTKVWPYADHPLIEVGRLVLDRNPSNYFAEVEQAAFNPANFVPGIGPSPDRLLQGRLFSYGDAQRYRLGINHTLLPVNRPLATTARTYGRDGAMRCDDNGGADPNYEPNSRGGPAESGRPASAGVAVAGVAASQPPPTRPGDDDFAQAGSLFRLMGEEEKARLVAALSGSLALVTRPGIVERCIAHFRAADAEFGRRLESAVQAERAAARMPGG